jgi:serine/threonine protein phosphatase PrpC
MKPRQTLTWQCGGQSVRGANHYRSGLMNQDALRWFPNYPDCGRDLPLILAVADGHGSTKSFRSDRGSRIAVETAIAVMRKFFLDSSQALDFRMFSDREKRQLCQTIHQKWLDRINQDWRLDPVANDHQIWQILSHTEGANAQEVVLQYPQIAYGTTLLAAMATEEFILYLQIGDGDILCVDRHGNVTRPMQFDPRMIANQTTSLCLPNAWQEFQVVIHPYHSDNTDELPVLILMSTDGYANSFPSEQDFLTIGGDYLCMLRSQPLQTLEKRINQFLSEASQYGSGDDITLGILRRLEPDIPKHLPDRTTSNHPPNNPMVNMTPHTELPKTQLESGTHLNQIQQQIETHQRRINQQILRLHRLVFLLLAIATASLIIGIFSPLYLNHRLTSIERATSVLQGPPLPPQQPSKAPSSPQTTPSTPKDSASGDSLAPGQK